MTASVTDFTEAATDPKQSCFPVGATPSRSAWVTATTGTAGIIVVKALKGTFYDTVISGYSGTCDALNERACNDDAHGKSASEVQLKALPGELYRFMITDKGNGAFANLELGVGLRTLDAAAVKCQVAIERILSGYADTVTSGTQACAAAMLRCIEERPSDSTCIAKSAAVCGRSRDTITLAQVRGGVAIRKACEGKGANYDAMTSTGLIGYDNVVGECYARLGIDAGDVGGLLECLFREQQCDVAETVRVVMPRVGEMMTLAGIEPDSTSCMSVAPGRGGLGDPRVGVAMDKCLSDLAQNSRKIFATARTADFACVNAALKCRPVVGFITDQCRLKAQDVCDRALVKRNSAIMGASVSQACSQVDFATVIKSAEGGGVGAIEGVCEIFGSGPLGSLDDYEKCVGVIARKSARSLVSFAVPRADELMALIGRTL